MISSDLKLKQRLTFASNSYPESLFKKLSETFALPFQVLHKFQSKYYFDSNFYTMKFSMSAELLLLRHSLSRAFLLYRMRLTLSTTFLVFFHVFSAGRADPHMQQLVYVSKSPPRCQHLFSFFFFYFSFPVFRSVVVLYGSFLLWVCVLCPLHVRGSCCCLFCCFLFCRFFAFSTDLLSYRLLRCRDLPFPHR